jgi:L-threonylcarbamoyladenylate synthase
VFPARRRLPPLLTAGGQTIAVRQTSQPLAKSLIDAFNSPITGTSANISGQEPVREISFLADELAAACDMLLDGGKTPGGLSSTIVGLRDGGLTLLRPGAVDIEMATDASHN